MEVSKEPELLDGWFTSEDLYSLERRAIFSKTWILASHRSRFTKPGDYISLSIAGYPLLVILGKDNIVRAFHNVCRHRAYTITKKAAGSSLVLGCRYHGWSYNSRGELVKAPHFDGIDGFDKSENGLFKIRTCVDRAGFIYVNLSTQVDDAAPECTDAVAFANENGIATSGSVWATTWELEGNFNWKVNASPPEAISSIPDPDPRSINISGIPRAVTCFFSRTVQPPSQIHPLQDIKTVHITPITTLFSFPATPYWAILTTSPVSALHSKITVNVFHKPNDGPKGNEYDVEILRPYIDKYVKSLEQRYLALVSRKRESEPRPRVQDDEWKAKLTAHLKLEQSVGRQILPASRCAQGGRAERVVRDLEALARPSRPRCDSGLDLSGNGTPGKQPGEKNTDALAW